MEKFAYEHNMNMKRMLFGKARLFDEWEIMPKELKLDVETVLGKGISGMVYKGHIKKMRKGEMIEADVAVKFIHTHANRELKEDMMAEIEFFKAIGKHDNLLVMVGYVNDVESPVIATEFCSNGDLIGVLRKH